MATRQLPYQNRKTAELFVSKMAAPWQAEVIELQEIITKDASGSGLTDIDQPIVNSEFEWQNDDLYKTFRDDDLTDLLYARTRYYQKSFDMRPAIREAIKPILQAEKEHYLETGAFTKASYQLEVMNMIREVVGLSPLPEAAPNKTGFSLHRLCKKMFNR